MLCPYSFTLSFLLCRVIIYYSLSEHRSKKAQAMLKALPSRPAEEAVMKEKLDGQTALLKDFNALQKELKEEGFFEPAPMHVLYRVTELALMHVFGGYLLLNFTDNYVMMVCAASLFPLSSFLSPLSSLIFFSLRHKCSSRLLTIHTYD